MKRAFLIWLQLFVLNYAFSASGQEFSYTIGNGFEYQLLKHREYISFRETTPSKEEILSRYPDSEWNLAEKEFLHSGSFNKHTWTKFRLNNQSEQEDFILEVSSTYIDSLKTFVFKNGLLIQEFPTKGLYFPENVDREFLLAKHGYYYPISIQHGDTVTVLMKSSLNKGIMMTRHELFSPKQYEVRKKETRIKTSYLLLLSGFALLVILVSMVFYLFTRDKIQLFYAAFVIVNVLNIMVMAGFFQTNVIQKYLFMGQNYSDCFGLLQILFGVQYAIHFLQLKENTPRIYRVLIYFSWFNLLVIIATLFFRNIHVVLVATTFGIKFMLLFAMFVPVGAAVHLVFKGKLMARYFVAAYIPLTYFVIHYFLLVLGFIHVERIISFETVVFLEIFILTIAMAHRYYLIGKSNRDYQETINRQQAEQIQYIIGAQEEERSRIAKELHDGVVQEIGTVVMGLRSLSENSSEAKKNQPAELLERLEHANRDIRTLSHRMMPRALEESGILAATKEMLKSAFQFSSIDYSFETFAFEQKLQKNIQITIYRIAQELSNNVIKHSKATHVSIQLYQVAGEVVMSFEDDGCGIDSKEDMDGMGMRNIRSRLELVSGKIKIESNIDKGSLISVSIPIASKEL